MFSNESGEALELDCDIELTVRPVPEPPIVDDDTLVAAPAVPVLVPHAVELAWKPCSSCRSTGAVCSCGVAGCLYAHLGRGTTCPECRGRGGYLAPMEDA